MNWYNIFYWVTRADSIKDFFDVTSNIFTFLAIISFIVFVFLSAFAKSVISDNQIKTDEEAETNPSYRGYRLLRRYFGVLFYTLLGLSLITWVGYVFTPTKKETLLIIAGGGTMNFLTTDSTAKQIPKELSNFVVTELKSMAADAKIDLGISDQKDKILQEAKNMSASDLINKMKSDSNFAKIIINENK